jgi:hypothetical protein
MRTFVQNQELGAQSVTQPVIANGVVGLTQIEDGAIITQKVRDQAITNDKLAPNSVTSDKIADGTVIAQDIAPGAVDTLELSNSAVTNPKLAINAVTSTNISDSAVINSKLAVNSVATTNVTDSAITNPKIAVNAITSANISDSAVINSKLAVNSVATSNITDSAVTNPKIAVNAVTSTNISDSAVINSKLAVNAVATTNITDSAVTNPKLSTNAVTSTNISDSAVINSKLAINAVTSDKIAAGNVVTTIAQVGGITLTDNVNFEGGTNILLETLTAGNKIRISNITVGSGSATINILGNGGFSIWQRGANGFTSNGVTADRWSLALGSNAATVSQEGTAVDRSAYAMKVISTISSGVVSISQSIENFKELQGQDVSLTVRVRPGTVGTIIVKITDSNGSTSSSVNVGTGSYETLTALRTIGASISSLSVSIEISASQTCYIDNAMFSQSTSALAFAPLSPAEEWQRCQRYFELGYNDFSKYGASDDTTYYIDDDIDFNTIKLSNPVLALSNVQIYEDGLGLTNAVSSYTFVLGITDHLLRGFSLRASKTIGGQRPVRMAFNWTATAS